MGKPAQSDPIEKGLPFPVGGIHTKLLMRLRNPVLGTVVFALAFWAIVMIANSAYGADDQKTVEFVLGTAAFVDKIVDGDTLRVRAEVWPGVIINTLVRIGGIDAPEIRRPNCDAEKEKGLAAKRALERLVPVHDAVVLSSIKNGKYAGRVIAQVITVEGLDVGAELLATGHAQPYKGRGPRPLWCQGADVIDG